MMEKISIEGGKPLFGKVEISGSKNSSLAVLASCLLTDKKISIRPDQKIFYDFFGSLIKDRFELIREIINNIR